MRCASPLFSRPSSLVSRPFPPQQQHQRAGVDEGVGKDLDPVDEAELHREQVALEQADHAHEEKEGRPQAHPEPQPRRGR